MGSDFAALVLATLAPAAIVVTVFRWRRGPPVDRALGAAGSLLALAALTAILPGAYAVPYVASIAAPVATLLASISAFTLRGRWALRGLAAMAMVSWLLPHLAGVGLMGPSPASSPPSEVLSAEEEALVASWRDLEVDRLKQTPTVGLSQAVRARRDDAIARGLFHHDRREESAAWLRRLLAEAPNAESAPDRWLMLAEVELSRGDLDAARRATEASLRHPPNDTERDVMDADNTANLASELLCRIAARQGRPGEAFLAAARWHPTSWCGNCATELVRRREDLLFRSFWLTLPAAIGAPVPPGWILPEHG